MTDEKKVQQSELQQENVRYIAISPEALIPQNSDDEIDLRELWNAIWSGKWVIIGVTALFAIASVFYALSLPNIYKSEALLAPASSEQQGGLGALAGQFGGLASLAGVNLGGGKANKTDMAIEILKSREFISRFIQEHHILHDLMAAKDWDLNSNTVIYNEESYSPEYGKWLTPAEPSMQQATKALKKLLNIEQNNETGMVNISVEHYSPYVAKQWVDWLIKGININMKMRDKKEANESIAYLQSQIKKTTIFEHKTLLYQLIEEQTKTLMFAEVRDEYVFKTIDPALVPELKFKPKRVLKVALGTFLGGILSLILIFIFHARRA
jgi:uncharacterized protein involved in exopolysaccharide biosynthesis